ncbi:uncharacterized protein [Anabrus simplex]|uniref:uncharacterized protein n=1 Tax=Anabrus simplex TaxID=316456 RepID=UPI0035A2EC66
MDRVLRKEYNMKINKSKTKVMECSRKKSGEAGNTRLRNGVLKEYCYLGSKITNDGRSKEDIKCRLTQARKSFLNQRNLRISNIDIGIRKTFMKAFVWNMALYGCETWTITNSERKRMEAVEMWCYRRMLKVRWIHGITNGKILNQIGERRSIWLNLARRKDRMIGHVLRHPGVEQLVFEGSAGGKSGRGRPAYEYQQMWDAAVT